MASKYPIRWKQKVTECYQHALMKIKGRGQTHIYMTVYYRIYLRNLSNSSCLPEIVSVCKVFITREKNHLVRNEEKS